MKISNDVTLNVQKTECFLLKNISVFIGKPVFRTFYFYLNKFMYRFFLFYELSIKKCFN